MKKADKLKQIESEYVSVARVMKEFFSAEEILSRQAKGLGSGAYVPIPRRHLGKTCRVFVMKNTEDDTNEKTKKTK